MEVSRLDLDGTGSPLGLVGKILKAEPNLRIPVPIEELAYALDIGEISELTTEGFEGGLLTDDVRSFGGILVCRGANRHRKRFTIGHELGHFLIPTHKPARDGQFLCSSQDMRSWNASEQNRASRMEKEANEFSASILVPPPHLRKVLSQWRDPNLQRVIAVHENFDVSREMAARAYAKYQGSRLAMLIVRDGKILRIYRSDDMPRLSVKRGDALPPLRDLAGSVGSVSDLRYADAGLWIENNWGERLPTTYQQALIQSNGFATVMLWCEPNPKEIEDYDPDADKTAKERFRDKHVARDPYLRN